MMGLAHFRNTLFQIKKDTFEHLAEGQSPETLFMTCSDSRVMPELLTQPDPGEIFVIRNAGNIIPPQSVESGVAATIEYALKKLPIKEIIVCGHSHCGAMKGLLAPNLDGMPHVASWLVHTGSIRQKIDRKHPELADDSTEKLELLIKKNVVKQIKNLKTHSSVIKKLEAGALRIHGWYYQLETGEVSIYDANSHTFMTYNQALEQLFMTPEVKQKVERLVEEQAINYLLMQSTSSTQAEYQRCSNRLIQIKRAGVSAIWDDIKTSVADTIGTTFNPMFKDSAEVMTYDFFAKSSEIKLSNLSDVQHQLEKSKGYQEHCCQIIKTSGLFHERATITTSSGANFLSSSI